MKIKDTLIGLFAIGLIGALGYLLLTPAGLTEAPDISVTTIQGESIKLSDLKGKPVLVNFWATTCPGCVKEMPHLVELYQEFASQGFTIIGIAMSYDPPNQVVALTKAKNIPYSIALDLNDNAAKAFGDVRLTPTSFLIAPDGRVVHQKIGELDMVKLRTRVISMLANQS